MSGKAAIAKAFWFWWWEVPKERNQQLRAQFPKSLSLPHFKQGSRRHPLQRVPAPKELHCQLLETDCSLRID